VNPRRLVSGRRRGHGGRGWAGRPFPPGCLPAGFRRVRHGPTRLRRGGPPARPSRGATMHGRFPRGEEECRAPLTSSRPRRARGLPWHRRNARPAHRETGAESFVSQPPGGTAMDPRAGGPTAAGGPAGPGAPDAPSPTGTPRSVERRTSTPSPAPPPRPERLPGAPAGGTSPTSTPRRSVARCKSPDGRWTSTSAAAWAFFAVSDCAAWYWAADGGAGPARGGVPALAVDVSRPARPRCFSRLDLEARSPTPPRRRRALRRSRAGCLGRTPCPRRAAPAGRPGDLAYVASFDLSDRRAPRAVARVDFPAAGWESHAT